MQKKRINEIKKGLEKEIYSKIKDIEIEEKKEGDFGHVNSRYIPTDFLADILPKKEDNSLETIQIIEKNSVDLELDQDEVFKKYDDYLYEEEKSKKTDNILDELKSIKEEKIDTPQSDIKISDSYNSQVQEPSIPKYQTEEHLKIIEEDIKEVELRYIEEEQEKFEEIQKHLSSPDTNIEDIDIKNINMNKSKEDSIDNLENFEDLDIEDADYYDKKSTLIGSNKIEDIAQLEQVHLELSNDFVKEDDIILPDVKIINTKNKSIEDSQFIFEQDIEEENLEDYTKTNKEEKEPISIDSEEFESTTFVSTKNPLQDPTEKIDFWDEEDEYEESSKRYIDFILIAIIIILILIVVKMIGLI